jgi:hypothetical protein
MDDDERRYGDADARAEACAQRRARARMLRRWGAWEIPPDEDDYDPEPEPEQPEDDFDPDEPLAMNDDPGM